MQDSQSAQGSMCLHALLQPAPGALGAGIKPFHKVTPQFPAFPLSGHCG